MMRLAIVSLLFMLAGLARAEDGVRNSTLVEAKGLTRDPVFVVSRGLLPGTTSQAGEVQGRWWLSRSQADFGLGLGTLAFGTRPAGNLPGRVDGLGMNLKGTATVLSLGLRYRTSDRSALFAEAADWHGPSIEGRDAFVGKVGLEFQSAQSFLNISYGGLGMTLAGDTRLTVRPRRGGIGLVMRSTF